MAALHIVIRGTIVRIACNNWLDTEVVVTDHDDTGEPEGWCLSPWADQDAEALKAVRDKLEREDDCELERLASSGVRVGGLSGLRPSDLRDRYGRYGPPAVNDKVVAWQPIARHLHPYRPKRRPLSANEVDKLEARAIAFCDRREIEFTGHPSAIDAIEKYLECMWEAGAPAWQDCGLAWRLVVRRATRAIGVWGVEWLDGGWCLVGRPTKWRRNEVRPAGPPTADEIAKRG